MFWKSKKKPIEDDYGKTVKALKDDKKQIVSKLVHDNTLLLNEIKKFNSTDLEDVTFKEMRKFKINGWVQINPKVRTRCVFKNKNRLVFETEIKRGGIMANHIHSDCIEIIDVHNGIMLDAHTGVEYKEGTHVEYDYGVPQQPYAIEDCFLIVTFTK